jgi:hypothetical protein
MKIAAQRAGILYVKYNLPSQGRVRLAISDIMGRLVAKQGMGMCETGSGLKRLAMGQLAQGLYFVTLHLETEPDRVVSVVRNSFVLAR